ncbi:dihydrofolate reductase family protein [Microbacterium sp. SS28]|uniref:dihydrofolate reductase family protein n=1 Tax=Microbacterium sp. SS28 TaxID=2919948 RepID=UPI001FA967EE|nr:dihydrofolate reductase family protein [Microbacterium sp. SS28]
MTRLIFNTATTLDGYIADPADSLSWLFTVPGAGEAESDFGGFLATIGALVMGSTTYEWILHHEDLLAHPERWQRSYADRLSIVMTSRDLPAVPGARLHFRSGSVADVWAELQEAAEGKDVWVVGGGDLVGQFADAGLLDEVRVSVAPVTLGAGRPLLPRRIESDRLTLESVAQKGQFAELVYRVTGRA